MIWDFTAITAMNYKQMLNVWRFNLMPELWYEILQRSIWIKFWNSHHFFIFYPSVSYKILHSSSTVIVFISFAKQMPAYHFPWGNLSKSYEILNVRFFNQHPLSVSIRTRNLFCSFLCLCNHICGGRHQKFGVFVCISVSNFAVHVSVRR